MEKLLNKNLDAFARFSKVALEKNRLRIIHFLLPGPKCVCEIWENLGLPQNLVSHHLKILKDFNLVASEKKGSKVFYKLNQKVVSKYVKLLKNLLKN